MSKFINNIAAIQTNVFSLTPILVSFFKNLERKDRNLLFAYLVFPIVLDQQCLEELIEIRSNSRLNRITGNKKYMAGFQQNFEYYKGITNNCLQYAVNCKYIKIENDLSVTVINEDTLYMDSSLDSSIRLASQLHKIFTLDVLNTYLAFGIKRV